MNTSSINKDYDQGRQTEGGWGGGGGEWLLGGVGGV